MDNKPTAATGSTGVKKAARPAPRRIVVRGRLSPTYLIADTREGAVIPFLDDALTEHAHFVAQINVGDYNICRTGSRAPDGPVPPAQSAVLACVERKSLVDFAASIRDGRYEKEVGGMLRLREETGCQLFFFVEGPAFPNLNRKFSKTPYSTLLSACTSLMVRDGIFIVQTEDEAHTAKRLADLMRTFDAKVPVPVCVANNKANVAPECKQTDTAVGAGDEDDVGTASQALTIPEALTRRVEPTASEIAVDMWSRLSGVSIVLGKALTKEMSVADLVGGWISEAEIKKLKSPSGKTISKTAIESLLAVRDDLDGHAVKLISGIRGMSVPVATAVLAATKGLKALCGREPAQIAHIEIAQKNRKVKLGLAKARQILSSLRYKDDKGLSLGQSTGTPSPAKTATGKIATTKTATTKAATTKAATTKAATVLPTLSTLTSEPGAVVIELTEDDLDEILAL
jgi:ERCC4-type nuclease